MSVFTVKLGNYTQSCKMQRGGVQSARRWAYDRLGTFRQNFPSSNKSHILQMGSRGPTTKAGKPGTIKFRAGVPTAPEWLDDEARAEYTRAVEELAAADASVQQPDMAMLATYAQAYADVGRLTKYIREEGEVTQGVQGPVANPRLRALSLAQRSLHNACQKLGFSPADRARVPKAAASSKPDNAFSAFVK